MDHEPLGLPSPNKYPLKETTEEHFPEEDAPPLTPPTKIRRRVRCSKRPVFKKRRRVASFVLLLLVMLTVGGLLYLNNTARTYGDPLEGLAAPLVEPETVAEDHLTEEESAEEETADEEEPAPAEEATEEKDEESTTVADNDATLYLTVPKMGLYGHTVRNDSSEAALDLGAIKLPSTEFPWKEGDTNTYIACHRLGWPDNESYNQCLNLPSMQRGDEIVLEDGNGMVYEYRVVETLAVEPSDTWVTAPVAGKDIISLQTCIEDLDDFYTLGPNWSARFVVRAERTEGDPAGGFRRLVGESVVAYTSLLHMSFFSYYRSILRTVSLPLLEVP